MDITEALQTAQDLLNQWTSGMSTPDMSRLDVVVAPKDLKPAVRILQKAHWGYLSAITGIDHPPVPVSPDGKQLAKEGSLEMLYHFCEGAAITTLRVSVPYTRPVIPSICEILPYATLYEREANELFGVTFRGAPNTDHFVLPDDWPNGVYPLRKSFTGFNKPQQSPTDQGLPSS
jgi:NADH:ubiquinone oxidoreductase subunit C